MTIAQQELKFFQTAEDSLNVQFLLSLLADGEWWSSDDIRARIEACGRKVAQAKINSWAQAAGPRIISGHKGYKLTAKATPEEYNHCINTRRAQARAHLSYIISLQKFIRTLIG